MLLGIGRDGNFEIRDPLDARGQIGAVAIATGEWDVGCPYAFGRVAAQGDDMADAVLPLTANDVVDLLFRRRNAGQVRSGFQ